ncbi:MEKHLA domain-containing protein [Lyngbya aestuarii]|uniref:MEKHLA domain-containing protein n=1 Tax=Lyngbya aestuarii TaxID=118322 RepID=UPI00403DC19E
MPQEIWTQPAIINWSQLLLDNYQQRLGCELIARKGNAIEEAKALFFAPFVVVSHGVEDNPIFNYGNQTALDLWEMNWEDFTRTPSQQPVEPVQREEREKMLAQVAEQGFIDDYRGVRISSKNRRFLIEEVIVWNLTDTKSKHCGQAATFPRWSFLN